jgi:hypothetical protein
MRNNIICSLAAVLAAFAQFMAVFATFALPVASIAGQPAGAVATDWVTRQQSIRGVAEVIVEVRHAI